MDKRQDEFIERLYHEMHDFLFSYAQAVLHNPGLAEETVQETFMIVCQKIDGLMKNSNPKGWIVNTLKNVIRNENRSRARLSRFLIQYSIYNADMLRSGSTDDHTEVEYSGILSDEDFRLLKMYVFEGRSMLEISEESGLNLEVVKKRIQRAREKLRKNEKI